MLTFPQQRNVFTRLDLDQDAGSDQGVVRRFDGIDVVLMTEFAQSLGVKLIVRPVSEPDYGMLIPDLEAGLGDLIASSLSITAERKKRVDFSEPYFEILPTIITRRDSTLASVDDLRHRVAAVTRGSSHEERLQGMGFDGENLLSVDFSVAAASSVLDGDADFTLQDSLTARRLLTEFPDLHKAFYLDGVDFYGIAVMKGSPLKAELDRFIARMKSEGTLSEILRRFGAGEIQAPAS